MQNMDPEALRPDVRHEGLLSRRGLLSGGALGLAAALAGCTPSSESSSAMRPRGQSLAVGSKVLTTLDGRLVAGDKTHPGKPYRRLSFDAPQRLVVRQELRPAGLKRALKRKSLVTFGHLTDTHILDPTSPGHTNLLFWNPRMDFGKLSARYFRPQDALTVQVMNAMMMRLNAIAKSPITGRAFDCHVSTGDASNSRGLHELTAFINILNGKPTSAFSFPGYSNSVQSAIALPTEIERFVWQPVPSATRSSLRIWQDTFGFPTVPSLLGQASKMVATEGVNVPWYSGFGNHDRLSHDGSGAFDTPIASFYRELNVSDKLVFGLPSGVSYDQLIHKLDKASKKQVKELIAEMPGPTVRSSIQRRPLSKKEFIQAHLSNSGIHGPKGHGFTERNLEDDTGYYSFNLTNEVTGIMLDTTDPSGGAFGNIGAEQAKWLESELSKVSSTLFSSSGNVVRQEVDDKYVVIFSHHPSSSFGRPLNDLSGHGAVQSPEAIRNLLARFPNVILWVNGHLHSNNVWPRKSSFADFGFWEVNTASHIDFPQQSRILDIVDNKDGSLSIFGILVDHSEPMASDYAGILSAPQLASLSAELALNNPRANNMDHQGTDLDKNVELVLGKPF